MMSEIKHQKHKKKQVPGGAHYTSCARIVRIGSALVPLGEIVRSSSDRRTDHGIFFGQLWCNERLRVQMIHILQFFDVVSKAEHFPSNVNHAAEICQLRVTLCVEEHILRFQVPIYEAKTMNMIQSQYYFSTIKSNTLFRQHSTRSLKLSIKQSSSCANKNRKLYWYAGAVGHKMKKDIHTCREIERN